MLDLGEYESELVMHAADNTFSIFSSIDAAVSLNISIEWSSLFATCDI